MIDLHCHVLAGIDDGPRTIEDSVALAREALASGTDTLVATPHVSLRYANDHETIRSRVDELNARLRADGVAVAVRAGAELAMTYLIDMQRAELARFGLGGGPWLLVEPPFTPSASGLEHVLAELRRDGHRVLLAHPERSPAFQRSPEMLADLVSLGVLTSITAGSLVGRFGGGVRRFAYEMLDAELVHNVASDAHDATERHPRLADDLEQAGLGPLSDWLAQAVPSAILAGEETIPARPALAMPLALPKRRRWWHRARLTRAS